MGKGDWDGGPIRRPSHKGSLVTYVRRGQIVFAKWPRPAKTRLTTSQKKMQRFFVVAGEAVKRMEYGQIEWAKDIARNTRYLWRDVLFMALAGKLATVQLTNGRKLYSMTSIYEVSMLLDALGQVPGSMLYRQGELWTYIPPGAPGDVLRFAGPTQKPSWGPGGAPGGTSSICLLRTSNSAASTIWPRAVPFEQALFDDTGQWNPATPTMIPIPPAATRARVTASIRLTLGTTSRTFFAGLMDQAGAENFVGGPVSNNYRSTGGFDNNIATLAANWFPLNGQTAMQIRINRSGSPNEAFLAGTTCSVEFS